MSAEDVEPQVELEPAAGDAPAAENGAAEQDPEARYRYDESLLIKTSKGTVRRPQKPDEQERNLAVEKLNAEIDKRSARIKEIKEMVEATRSARSAGASGNQEIVRRVKALQQEFQTILVRCKAATAQTNARTECVGQSKLKQPLCVSLTGVCAETKAAHTRGAAARYQAAR